MANQKIKSFFLGGPTWLENDLVRSVLKPVLTKSDKSIQKIFNTISQRRSKGNTLKFLTRNLMDVGFISAASFFFASASLGVAPFTAFAGVGLSAVVATRFYQEVILKNKFPDPEKLNKKNKLLKLLQRPGASYALSSLTTMSAIPLLFGLCVSGAIPGIGTSLLVTTQLASIFTFGTLFSISNNIKSARLDKDRGYDVEPLPLIRNLNPSWSEKLSIVGNIARNFMAGPVVGLLSLPFMLEALKFSNLDKKNETLGMRSYTDKKISNKYGWLQPKSDSGMARVFTGLGKVFAAVSSASVGNFSSAISLGYPAVALFVLGEKSHQSYSEKLKRHFSQAAMKPHERLRLSRMKFKAACRKLSYQSKL